MDHERNEINANIEIVNGTQVTATLSLYAITRSFFNLFDGNGLFGEKVKKPRSFTIVHHSNATAFGKTAIGQRQPGDQLLYFRSKTATNMNRFAQTDFEFIADENKTITCVGFSVDVRYTFSRLSTRF